MRDPNRIKRIMSLLQRTWEEYPDMRLNQLLMNIHGIGEGTAFTRDFFYQEDTQTERSLLHILEEGCKQCNCG